MDIKLFLAAIGFVSATSANAVVVSWADWQSNTATTAYGQITSGGSTVDVNLATSGENLAFVQLGTQHFPSYWTGDDPSPYTSGIVENGPPSGNLVALNAGGTKTITFGKAVTDPYIAFVSWNGNVATFTQPFEKISEGCGYWGCGSFSLGEGNTFMGVGEPHGILRFTGTFTQVSFTDDDENWHGLTIGIGGVAAVPEPANWAMLIAGFGLTGAVMRRRRTLASA